MKVVMDLSPSVQGHGGMGRYAEELARALIDAGYEKELGLFYVDRMGRKPGSPLDRLEAKSLRWSNKPWRLSVLAASSLGLTMDRLCGDAQVFHATDHLLPPFRHTRSVFTLHDLAFLSHPETHLASNRWFLSLMVPRFLQRADAVICVSERTKQDALKRLRLNEAKLHVIPEGVSGRFHPMADANAIESMRRRYGLPQRYILCVSTIEPRKNLTTLLRAYESLRAKNKGAVGLVLVGRMGWKAEEFLGSLEGSPERQNVALVGQMPDEDLPVVYAGAELFAYPSLYEGFGLPVVEAMASGIPVVASTAGSLPEVVGDAGLLVEPTDREALAAAMGRLIDDQSLRSTLAARGIERARGYSWEVAALRTREVYASVCKGK